MWWKRKVDLGDPMRNSAFWQFMYEIESGVRECWAILESGLTCYSLCYTDPRLNLKPKRTFSARNANA